MVRPRREKITVGVYHEVMNINTRVPVSQLYIFSSRSGLVRALESERHQIIIR
jgi:hypothetical protein